MCGIAGIIAFEESGKNQFNHLESAVKTLSKRGPDSSGTFIHGNIALGHTRLAIIDPSEAGNQPFSDESGRYTIVYNGEFYNFREERELLKNNGYRFDSDCDTEVLLKGYIHYGEKILDRINGCFSFAIYDKQTGEIFAARDRFGINPLVYYRDDEKLIFASELKAILAFGIKKEINAEALYTYLQLNYIPGEQSILNNVFKLLPGHYFKTGKDGIVINKYYSIPVNLIQDIDYKKAQDQLKNKLRAAVQRRLVADVPIGAFLSGGIDSSIIAGLASQESKNLNTFSIGYADEPFFDETRYAESVARKFGTNHTVFSIKNKDLFEILFTVLDYFDEPFADSSALAVYILSHLTRKTATVALSGDGADEMFAGYNKHMAHYKAHESTLANKLIKNSSFLYQRAPKSRNSALGNKMRQMKRFGDGLKLSEENRYWHWCSLTSEKEAEQLLKLSFDIQKYKNQKKSFITAHDGTEILNSVLYRDMHLVLPFDMLTKVDMMSMANSLEVRTPFLDHEVVDFAFSLPSAYKIDNFQKKKILQDAFRDFLPAELYNRPKQGFEVPLLKWFRNELNSYIENELNEKFIEEQGIFNPLAVTRLKNKLRSANPEDSAARIWGLIVFQHWYKKHCV